MKKFCLVIAVILVFVCSCDNLYNEVAEEKKDMQKLIFVNADGVSVDLTKDPFGITEWEGFSKVDLNLQTQQVPFHDGSVYLDGLLSERELSVTLAMNDEKNLEKRYRLRRELIEILNPKLGEGTLIYTNNYTSKQIKVVPQTPLFENHNSNDVGTPKASLAWTACSPYWEDVEESIVYFEKGDTPLINNNGDVSTQIKLDLTGSGINPKILNHNNGQSIQINTQIDEGISIDTNFGNKYVHKNEYSFESAYDSLSVNYSIASSPDIIVLARDNIMVSTNGVDWRILDIHLNYPIRSLKYIPEINKFIAVSYNKLFWESSDGINWTSNIVANNLSSLDVAYSTIAEKYVIVSGDEDIFISSDGENWTHQLLLTNGNIYSITYAKSFNKFVVLSKEYSDNAYSIKTSSDGNTWDSYSLSGFDSGFEFSVYSDELEEIVIYIHRYESGSTKTYAIISNDGVNWQITQLDSLFYFTNVTYFENIEKFIGVTTSVSGHCYIRESVDGVNWNIKSSFDFLYEEQGTFYADLTYFNKANMYVCYVSGSIFTSSNLYNWIAQKEMKVTLRYNKAKYSEKIKKYYGVESSHYFYESEDGVNWTKTKTNLGDMFDVYDCYYAEDLNIYLCCGLDGYTASGFLARSTDGISWTVQYFESIPELGYAYNPLFISYGNNTYFITGEYCFYTSTDGINWTKRTYPENYMGMVIFVQELNVFLTYGGQYNSKEKKILVSSDGINWSTAYIGDTNDNIVSIIYSKRQNIIIAIEIHGSIITSNNAINWDKTGIAQKAFTAINYSEQNNLYVICSSGGSVFVSVDGVNWTEENIGYDLTFNNILYNEKTNSFILYSSTYSEILLKFQIEENAINLLSTDSDMTFCLEKGVNKLQLFSQSGSVYATLFYRQKYLGV